MFPTAIPIPHLNLTLIYNKFYDNLMYEVKCPWRSHPRDRGNCLLGNCPTRVIVIRVVSLVGSTSSQRGSCLSR